MRVFLDERMCDVPADSVATAVQAAAALAQRSGRTITDVMVDGKRLGAEQLSAAFAGTNHMSAGEVRLISADQRTLVRQTLADASAALLEIDGLQDRAAVALQGGREPQAMTDLAAAIETWMAVHQAVALSAEALVLDLSAHASTIAQLADRLHTLRRGLERRDVASLADTLMYDMPQVVSEWRCLLHSLSERAGEAKG